MQSHGECRIVITGIGLCTPFGADRESSWQGICSGKSMSRWLQPPHWTAESRMPGAPVRLPTDRPFRHCEPLIELALITARESLLDAGLVPRTPACRDAGVVFGTSKGGLHTFADLLQDSRKTESGRKVGAESFSPLSWLDVLPNRAAVEIGRLIGSRGPNLCPVMACATGLAACLRGAALIEQGDCDMALVGSADVSLQPALLGSFRRLGVLSGEVDDAAMACRPFDRRRSGFVVGEGAACLVFERFEVARSRGAKIYAEWQGGRVLSDPQGLMQLDPTGQSLQRVLQDLQNLSSNGPDYINLHGTGTTANDLVECRAIREVFGRRSSDLQGSSLKGGMGHLLGAAGSVELAATALAIRDQIVPPTVNLVELDPECHLNLTPGVAVPKNIQCAWKISMGFGGHLAGACLTQRPC